MDNKIRREKEVDITELESPHEDEAPSSPEADSRRPDAFLLATMWMFWFVSIIADAMIEMNDRMYDFGPKSPLLTYLYRIKFDQRIYAVSDALIPMPSSVTDNDIRAAG